MFRGPVLALLGWVSAGSRGSCSVGLASLVGMHAGCGCLGRNARPALLRFLLVYSLIPSVLTKPEKLLRHVLQRSSRSCRRVNSKFRFRDATSGFGLRQNGHADNPGPYN